MRHKIEVAETPMGKVILDVLEVRGMHDGPTLCLVSGVHGDELSSVLGLKWFWEILEKIPQGRIAGGVIAIPFANPIALTQRTWGFQLSHSSDWENLNRLFPGDPQGTLGERLASGVSRILVNAKPELVVDLHTMPSRSLPFVIMDREDLGPELEKKRWHYADMFGLGVVHDLPPTEYEKTRLDKSLSASILRAGIASYTVEVSGVQFAHNRAAEIVRDGLWNLVYKLGIVSPEQQIWIHRVKDVIGVGKFSRFPGPRANAGGLFDHNLNPSGESWPIRVYKDQVVGEILNGSLEAIEKVRAPADGIISWVIEASMVSSGDELFKMLVEEKTRK